jgi:hypothetical protein
VERCYLSCSSIATMICAFEGDDDLVWLGGCRSPANDGFVWTQSCTTFIGPAVGMQTAEMKYSSWSRGQPDNAGGSEWCVVIAYGGLWMDLNCDSISYQFVCEIEN